MTIDNWLKTTTNRFADALLPSPRLDAEVILAHTIGRPRTWLHSHGEEPIDPHRQDIAEARVQLRLDRVPVAYITGHKEFYGRRFVVTPSVLIPRPESEKLIELLSDYLSSDIGLSSALQLVDVGSGSGCLGISAKLEHPNLNVSLLDIDRHALAVAQKNATLLRADVHTLKSDLLKNYPLKAHFVLANLPYVDKDWDYSKELKHEPAVALFAPQHGLELIYRLLEQLPASLQSGGYALLEADPEQHPAIIAAGKAHNLRHIQTSGYAVVLQRP